jgi:hypothetical protein
MTNNRHDRGRSRGPHLTDADAPADTSDPFKDIGQVARQARGQPTTQEPVDDAPDDPGPDLPDAQEAPAEAPAEQEKPLSERASAIIDAATFAIVDNIDTLISRAERLKKSIIDDTSEAKARITANLHHGGRILELSKSMNTQLDELEATHRIQIRGQQNRGEQ